MIKLHIKKCMSSVRSGFKLLVCQYSIVPMHCYNACKFYIKYFYFLFFLFLILAPQTPTDWSKKKREPLGKLSSLFKLLVMLINSFHTFSSNETCSEALVSVGPSIIAILNNIVSHVSLPSVIGMMFAIFSKPLAVFFEKTK